LLVDDDRDVPPGARLKAAFLADLRATVYAAADIELARAGRDSTGCPYLQRWFDHYERRPAAEAVEVLRRLAPSVSATSATDYVAPVTERLRAAVARWTETGEVTGLPPGLERLPPPSGPLRHVAGLLGSGQPLPHATRGPMERALGHDFGSVRVYADGAGAAAASRSRARAVAVGEDVAFAAGEYRPGTPAGDAVLAHELAHVAQQRAGGGTASGAALEADADVAATNAVRAAWAGERTTVRPALGSALRLQRCGGNAVAPVSDLTRLDAMTPWQLAYLPASSFEGPPTGAAAQGRTLADFRRAWQTVRCVYKFRHITEDPDAIRPLGLVVTNDDQLRAIRTGYSRMRDFRAQSLAATGGPRGLPEPPAPEDVPVRVVSGEEIRIKRYQFLVGTFGPDPAFAAHAREWWSDPQCAVTVNPNPVVTDQELRAMMLERTMGGEGGMFFEPERTIYVTEGIARVLAANTGAGLDASLTLTHESGHLLGPGTRMKDAFRRRFGDPAYQCFLLAFEEGMTERATRRVQAGVRGGAAEATTPPPPPTPEGRKYESFVNMADAVAAEVGNPATERAYYTGEVTPAVLDAVQRLFPVHVRNTNDLPDHCRSVVGRRTP
jgi:hypothetical protein